MISNETKPNELIDIELIMNELCCLKVIGHVTSASDEGAAERDFRLPVAAVGGDLLPGVFQWAGGAH